MEPAFKVRCLRYASRIFMVFPIYSCKQTNNNGQIDHNIARIILTYRLFVLNLFSVHKHLRKSIELSSQQSLI